MRRGGTGGALIPCAPLQGATRAEPGLQPRGFPEGIPRAYSAVMPGVLAAVALVLLLSGCYTLRPTQPGELKTLQPSDRLWVVADHANLTLDSTQLVGDSIVGVTRVGRASIALTDASRFLVREPSAGRTAALAAGVVAGITAVMYFVMVKPPGQAAPNCSPCVVNSPCCGGVIPS